MEYIKANEICINRLSEKKDIKVSITSASPLDGMAIISPNQNDTIFDNINEKEEPEKHKSVSDLTIDLNNNLINVRSLNINEYESRVIEEPENSFSSASNKAGSSIDDTYYHYKNHSFFKQKSKEIISNIYEKKEIEKCESTSKFTKFIKSSNRTINRGYL
ncbi:10161_t:CDS:2 [Rhizophagus irregularis]|nr:10161_t:CDS:2 [Rhizophagus irregularis]